MPITKSDVLAVLNDPVLGKMNFFAGPIAISAKEYQNVAEYISAGDIQITPGKQHRLAFYDRNLNAIEVQLADPPLNLADRAQLLHECTHAMADINRSNATTLSEEIAAYLAQVTFMKISDPKPFPRGIPGPGVSPFATFLYRLLGVVEDYNLHNLKGYGVRIDDFQIHLLIAALQRVPDYGHLKLSDRGGHPGVPIHGSQMRALRAAIKSASQPALSSFAVSPVLGREIF